jgi:hypothetical protein
MTLLSWILVILAVNAILYFAIVGLAYWTWLVLHDWLEK